MGEDAGLHIALVVDVDVLAPRREAAARQGAVAPEVGYQDRPRSADVHDPAPEFRALLGSEHEAQIGVASHGHVHEVPAVEAAFLDHEIGELIGDDFVKVVPGGRSRESDHGPAFPQAIHRRQHPVVRALASAGVGRLAAALDADSGTDVAQFDDCDRLSDR